MKRIIKSVACLLVFTLILTNFSETAIIANASNLSDFSGLKSKTANEFLEDSEGEEPEGEAKDIEESEENYDDAPEIVTSAEDKVTDEFLEDSESEESEEETQDIEENYDDTPEIVTDAEGEVTADGNNEETYSSTTITSGDWKYTVSENEVAIVGYLGSDSEVTIPGKIDGYPVTVIGNLSFYDCSRITDVTIPNSVTTIEDYAFMYCTGLTSITFPPNLTSLGARVLYGFRGTMIYFTGDAPYIASNAFDGLTYPPVSLMYPADNSTWAENVISQGYGGTAQWLAYTPVEDEDSEKEPSEDEDIVVVSGQTLSLGGGHSGVIAEDGSLYMWGNNRSGQVGNGSQEEAQTTPVKVLENVVSISLGYDHSGAITKNGNLYMWGDNWGGQVGNGSQENQSFPVKVLENVEFISLKKYYSGAITKDGNLYIWGHRQYGQIGNGGSIWTVETPEKILENVVSISLGENHSGAVTKDGSLYMWGDNSYGRVGNGSWEAQATPVKVLENVESISLGVSHSGAITKDGSLYMWGGNDYGQVGNGKLGNSQTMPVKVLENVESVSLGESHSGAITKDGSLYMWGNNGNGQVGNGSLAAQATPVKVLENVESISLGGSHSGAITKDGILYMWGNSGSGRLGNGSLENQTTPVKVLENVVSISLGESHSGAITKDRSLYMWGSNGGGQVGNGSLETQRTPVKVLENVKFSTVNDSEIVPPDGADFYFSDTSKYYVYDNEMSAYFAGNFEAIQKGNVNEEADAIVWKSSDPLVADIDHVLYMPDTGNIYSDDNAYSSAYFYLYLNCYKPGTATITGTSADGRTISGTITVEPKLIVGESTRITESSNIMLCKVDLPEKTDEQLLFLQTFFNSLDVNIVKGVKWDLEPICLPGGDFVGLYTQVDADSVSGRITIEVTSPGGQVVQIDVLVSNDISDNTVVYYDGDNRKSLFFDYSIDSCLEKNAAEYNPDLAYMLVALAKSAYHKDGLDFTLLKDVDGGTFPDNPLAITESLRNLGFEAENMREFNYYSNPSDTNYGKDTTAFTLATKKTSDGTTLISIVVRGSYGEIWKFTSDWRSNAKFINLGVGLHSGFNDAASEIIQELNAFMDDKSISEDRVKFVITGHSRGAAVSNLVAKKLIDNGVSSDNVYDYNFACPDTGRDFAINWNSNGKYDSLYNINNVRDIVGVIPGYLFSMSMHINDYLFERGLVFWGKYGHTYFFSEDWNTVTETMIGGFDQHEATLYLNYMSKKKSTDSFKSWEQARATLAANAVKGKNGKIFGVFCPVDIEIIDKDGVKIAEVVNGQTQYYTESFGDVVIITAGDQSLVYINGKNDYFVKFTGNDTGEMTYCVSDAVLGSEYGKEIKYTNVSLSQGKTMISILNDDEQSNKVTLVLFDGELKPVKQIDCSGTERELSDKMKKEYSNLPLDKDVLPDDIPSDGKIPDGIWSAGITDMIYTGNSIQQSFRIYDGNKRLTEKIDYSISYKNNKNAYTYEDKDYEAFEDGLRNTGKRTKVNTFDPNKAPQVIIKMKGNYSGSQIVYFRIQPIDITEAKLESSSLIATYSGKKQTPAPILTWKGKKLKYGTDFYVPEYDNAKNDKNAFSVSKTYDLTVVGKNNFTGEVSIKLTISASDKQIAMSSVTVKGIGNQAWTGQQIRPDGYTVKYKENVLSEANGDYTVSMGENTAVGTGTITLTGTGTDNDGDGYSYIGTKIVSFKITGAAMSKVTVSGVNKNYTYTGMAIEPSAILTYKADKNATPVTLVKDIHYTVAYQKNQERGTATIIFTGLESSGYTGTKKTTFKIAARGIADKNESENQIEQISITFKDDENVRDGIYVAPYMKGGAKPEVIVTSGGKTMKFGKDYAISYANNKNIALSTDNKAPTITVKGKGNYSGSKTVSFTIVKKPLSEENGITVVAKDKVVSTKMNGYRQSFIVYDADGKKLGSSDYDAENVIYTLVQTKNEDGTVKTVNEVLNKDSIVPADSVIRITVQGKGNYANGSVTGTYRILKQNYDISKATIQISNQTYTGQPVMIDDQSQFKSEKVYIKIGNEKKVLILGKDIEVVPNSYIKNVNKGTAKVTFQGINDFGGTKTVSYKIGTRSITDLWKGVFGKLTGLMSCIGIQPEPSEQNVIIT